MKKLFLITIITAVGLAANAQRSFGAKAGMNIANLRGDNIGLSSLISFNVGAFVNIPISSSMFSVQPEILYSGEGAQLLTGGKLALKYVNVPVMFQYNNSRFYGEIGPQIGLLASAKLKPEEGDNDNIKDQLKSTNFALAFGAGYKLTNGLGFNVRYNLGLSNIADADEVTLKSNTYVAGVFYTFKKSN